MRTALSLKLQAGGSDHRELPLAFGQGGGQGSAAGGGRSAAAIAWQSSGARGGGWVGGWGVAWAPDVIQGRQPHGGQLRWSGCGAWAVESQIERVALGYLKQKGQ